MRTFIWKTILFFVFVFVAHNAYCQKIADLYNRTWYDDAGSAFKINNYDPSTGQMTGTYKLVNENSLNFKGLVIDKSTDPLRDHDIALEFSVRFNNSICSWTGYLTKIRSTSALQIHVLSNRVQPNINSGYEINTKWQIFTVNPPINK